MEKEAIEIGFTQRQRDALDRYITGDYGEKQFEDDDDEFDDKPDPDEDVDDYDPDEDY
jgi:hypothetical protein